MEDPEKTLRETTRLARSFRGRLPAVKESYEELNAEVYKDGALSSKHKRLMALAAAVTQGCTGCMLFQAEEALAQGASLGEILEALAVSVALGGSMASSKTAQVMAYLEQKGVV